MAQTKAPQETTSAKAPAAVQEKSIQPEKQANPAHVARMPMSQMASGTGSTANPHGGSPNRARSMTAMQRSVGNARAGSMMRMPIQTKLTVNTPGDAHEQEADAVARQVVRNEGLKPIQRSHMVQPIQRQRAEGIQRCAECAQKLQNDPQATLCPSCEAKLRRKASAARAPEVTPEIENKINAKRGGGEPIADHVRAPMEQGMGADFGHVRVHTDSTADHLNRSMDSRAFATGNDIFFKQGEYNPGAASGRELLAHELTHTVQQGSAPQTAANRNSSVQMKHSDAVQLQKQSTNLQNQFSPEQMSASPTRIQRFGESLLPDMASLLGISVPKDPIEAVQRILSALDKPGIALVLRIFPGILSIRLSLHVVLAGLKLIQYFIQLKERVINEIKKYIEEKLETVPQVLEAKLQDLFGKIDLRHFYIIWYGSALPMLKELKAKWWEAVQEAIGEQLNPFGGLTTIAEPKAARTGLGKLFAEMAENLINIFIDLSHGKFSKALDDMLLLGKGFVGLLNRFYGWIALFIVASETISGFAAGAAVSLPAGGTGAIPGAIAGFGAGLASAGAIGEDLLIASIVMDGAVLIKSAASLEDFDSSLVSEEKAKTNGEYYKRIAESGISVSIMLALLALAWLGGAIAKSLLGKLISFLPKNVQQTLFKVAALIEKGMKGEKPTTADSINFRKTPPELNPELATLRENVKTSENIESVSDPEIMGDYDAEVKIGEHTYRRNKNGTWCRFSTPLCGVDVPEEINVRVDEALGTKPVKEISIGEEVTVPNKGGLARAKVVDVTDEFVTVKFPSRAKTKVASDTTISYSRKEFDRLLSEGEAIRWTQERTRLMKNRPEFDDPEGIVNAVWEKAKQPDGKVYDPGPKQKELTWDKSRNRWDQWHMGHKPQHEYAKLVDDYVKGRITAEEFHHEYNNPDNYHPEDPIENMNHGREAK